jgi:pimeloyl-ACP methyl ester carboxylesterase
MTKMKDENRATEGHRGSAPRSSSPSALGPSPFVRLPRRYVTFEGHRIAYGVAGTGPPVLLLHGLGGTADFWQPVVARLADGFTVVCPDLLGFGFSDKPNVDYTLARHTGAMLAVARAAAGCDLHAIVGHSAGGVVAVAMLATGAVVAGRVALAAAPYPTRRFTVRQELVPSPWFNRLLDDRRLARIDHGVFVALWQLARFLPVQEYLRGGWAGFMDYNTDSYYGTADELLFRSDLDRLLPTLRDLPVLLLYGPNDKTIPIAHGRRLAERLPHAQFVEVDGGHYAVLREGLRRLVEWMSAEF